MIKWTVASLLVSMGLALSLMLILRPAMLRGFGPRAQYFSWFLVPAFTLATMLPAPPIPLPLVSPEATKVVSETHRSVYQLIWQAQAQGSAENERPPSQVSWPIMAWLAGVGVLAGAVLLQHRRWSRQLRWDAPLGHWSLPAASSPSVVGLLRPRLALPVDFEQRFNEAEQAGVLAHEEVHAKRHDNLWNLIATTFWIVNWFNPVAWWALRAFQRDQELACDAAALARRDDAAHAAYRDALLKAFELSPSSVLSKGWRSSHPLIERLQWVQAGFTERTWLSVSAVLLALSVLSSLAYAVHGGGVWQIWGGTRPIPQKGYAQARVETQSQINGDRWMSGVSYLSFGRDGSREQRMFWTETLQGREVFNVLLKLVRNQDQTPTARIQVNEVLNASSPAGTVPDVRYVDMPPELWQGIELKTQSGDMVRLRVRFQVLDDPKQGI